MSFVPAGFWERFIARMLISLTEMDLQVVQQQHLKVEHGSRSHSTTRAKRYSLVRQCAKQGVGEAQELERGLTCKAKVASSIPGSSWLRGVPALDAKPH